jgi:hypothetical protein
MKKIFNFALFLLVFSFMFTEFAFADIIPPNQHTVYKCVKFVNLNEFKDVVLVAQITGPMSDNNKAYKIINNECLTKGYKFNSLTVSWTTKEEFNSLNLEELNSIADDVYPLLEDVEVETEYVNNSNPLIKEETEYSIAKFSGDELIVYKSKITSEYNNGKPKKVETFNNPFLDQEPINQNSDLNKTTSKFTTSTVVIPKPPVQKVEPEIVSSSSQSSEDSGTTQTEPVKRGFWKSIGCFFKGLFGKVCI